ncbi:T9SS type A sorting domain-containing protein [Flaviramulus sp. BrNp1-15]|uniref:T9SS type A sorting domain-containing protein n=1 Tax=Flaviramulus sp. BrNp1-15 TaxID=2916754 RepID=UPI001EE7D808|nr:T9SS type A sorting domain-containing protein [Flaviramulus sp. BrNp1-15]ULC59564.1 T9SS type A sorting domain-containing protein [Flaviramulus sp. BrNp1-15]
MKNLKIEFGFIFFSLLSFGQNLNSNTTSSFIYTPENPLNTKTVEVFYHIPEGDITVMPIVMSFHGANRNASDYRDYWINMANVNEFMVFAPEFSDSNYPGGDKYQLANIFDDGDNPSLGTLNNQNEWTFSFIDSLFEYIKADISGTQETYKAWGHSGGAQFLHRFVMYMPNSKLEIAVCSNAGWYTVPENTVNFPYGIKNGQLSNTTLPDAFAKKLIIHLGQDDTNQNSAGLRHNSIVDNQQGLNRYLRGQYFFDTSQSTSQTMSVPFNWEKQEVSGVSHNAQQMANDALQYVFINSLSNSNSIENKFIKVYPNPVNNILCFNNERLKAKRVKIYSVFGALVSSFNFNSFQAEQEIDVAQLNTGIYFFKLNERLFKVVKK